MINGQVVQMAGIAIFLPNEVMCRQAELVLSQRKHHVMINKATTIDNVVEEARKAIEKGVNIVVARGHQAGDVKQYTGVAVIEVVMTAQELGLLIVKAKRMVHRHLPKIGIFCWKGMLCDTTYFEQLYEVQLVHYELGSQDNWFEKVELAAADGVDVVIGGEKCVRYAAQKGMPAVFLSTTGESIEIAINQAEIMYDMAELEKRSYAQFATILDSSFNGIIKIGEDGIVQNMNRVMEEVLNVDVKAAVGQPILDIMPSMDKERLNRILTGAEEMYSMLISNEKTAMIVIAEPIVVDHAITGAIISCNRTRRLKWSEDKMKEKLMAGFVARETLEHLQLSRPGLKPVIDMAKTYAQSGSPILIKSDSFDEADLLCQGIHNYSLRRNGPFVVMNAANLADCKQMHAMFGILEGGFDKKQKGTVIKAGDGTLVIRAIDKLTLPVQRYLLSVIRKKRFGLLEVENESVQHVDVRIIGYTSKDLKKLVNQGLFRKDLYYLLQAFCIEIPRASERKEDMELLLENYYKKYLDKYSRYHILTPEAKEKLLNYPWENHDIQLESFCERMILTATKRKITAEYVQQLLNMLYDMSEEKGWRTETEKQELCFEDQNRLQEIRAALLKHNHNRKLTAQELNISTSTLWRYMKKYELS